jgi:hypothetical protein
MPDPAARPSADEELDHLLRQWRAQPAAQPRPFFYGRVRARLDRAAAQEQQVRTAWLRRSAYAAVLGALILALSGDRPAVGATPYEAGPGFPAAVQPVR